MSVEVLLSTWAFLAVTTHRPNNSPTLGINVYLSVSSRLQREADAQAFVTFVQQRCPLGPCIASMTR